MSAGFVVLSVCPDDRYEVSNVCSSKLYLTREEAEAAVIQDAQTAYDESLDEGEDAVGDRPSTFGEATAFLLDCGEDVDVREV